MKIPIATQSIAAIALSTLASSAFAHEGHATAGTHWHVTDTWGFVVITALAIAAIWWSRDGQ